MLAGVLCYLLGLALRSSLSLNDVVALMTFGVVLVWVGGFVTFFGLPATRMALVASKGTLDMAYPPLILATTAGSLGWEVGIFFTFYGLDILHRNRIGKLKVGPVGNPAMPPPIQALPWMKVPNIVGALPGMTAMATSMMKSWIARAKLPTIPELMDIAKELDVSLFA